MSTMKRLVAGAATTVLACAFLATAASAQDITGGISGKITDDAGKPLANVPVTIVFKGTNATLKTTTGSDGFYSLRNLQVGGPYEVTAGDTAHQTKTTEVPGIGVGDPYQLNLTLEGAGAEVQTVTVHASRIGGANITQTGPRSTFSANDIQQLPSFTRDLKDTARLNPFVTVDPTNSNALYIAGNNNKVSTVYLDGVRQSDNFGLGNSGYPTQRSPFSIDIVQSFNVEVAPYDVKYGDFQGGLLNVVTKSGTNEFHGSAFYEYDSSELGEGQVIGANAVHQPACANGAASGTGCGDRIVTTKFQDKNYGGYLSGPIIPDKLFFFVDYEEYQSPKLINLTPSDVQGPNPVKGITSGNVNQISSILQNAYGYNAGTFGASTPIDNKDYFARLDANLTDTQHLFVTYQRTDGSSLNAPNGSTAGTLGLSSDYYLLEQNLETYTADLTSHWTDKLSTEVEYTHQTIATPSVLEGGPFAMFRVVPSGAESSSNQGVVIGPDLSRQANNLSVTDQQIKARVNYTLGEHVLTLGYEHEDVTSSDLFVQNATGVYTFDSTCGAGNGILNLQNHQACSFTYANAFDNNPLTAAQTVKDTTDTLYLQDEFHPFANLTVKGGLRFEYYSTGDKPLLNPTFQQTYGFPNNGTIDGENILMPRVGFNWKPDPTLTIYGGAGLFSGGNPIVYTYDSYNNPGNLIGTVNVTCGSATAPASPAATAQCSSLLSNVTGKTIPAAAQQLVTQQANAGQGVTNSIDPNLKPFAEWKASIGAIKTFDLDKYHLGHDWRLHLDYLYQKTQYAPNWVDLSETHNVIGTAPDGRPVYNPNRFTTARPTGYDIELVDTNKGFGHVVAVGMGKTFADLGLDFDYTFTWQNVKDVSPATSSVALSNYKQNATADPNNPSLSTSAYEIKWENKLSVSWSHKFFGDFATKASLYMEYRAGLPFSYTFSSTTSSSAAVDNLFGQSGAAASGGGQLLYVPKADSSGNITATSDPKVTYGPGFNVAQFNTFLHQSGLIKYDGQIAPRNAFTASAVTTADLRIEQELPAFLPHKDSKLIGYLDIINVPNLLNKNWGTIYQTSFPGFQSPISAQNCQAALSKLNHCTAGVGNFYEYDTAKAVSPSVQTPFAPAIPTWAIRLGVRYTF
ncbi:carboxypeptidase regulatory-like domain-containing protein [Caulobacter sp. S45]|uniref:TonB-dependent receptor n=1 Tax=Caulobacter sp. S45 TaxID=1641861 RepID=UPI00131ADF74|nr:carboxypeptidase regulatory-like domain-containing protein [Caulobacter sp. S45]